MKEKLVALKSTVAGAVILGLLGSFGAGTVFDVGTAKANTYGGNSPIRTKGARLATLPNGAIINAEVVEKEPLAWHTQKETYEIAPGVYVIPGIPLNIAFIVGKDGVIVWESGEGNEDGEHIRAEIAKVTDKPIKALLYSHAHYALGSEALLKGYPDAKVIGHENLNDNMATGGLGSYFPETEPTQWARTMQHLQMLLPKEGSPDAQAGFVVNLGERGFVPVNTPVKHGDVIEVAGVRLQFFTDGGSDTNDCMTVWAPDLGVCLSNILWPMMPNFYTPRGATFRDPRVWRVSLEDMQKLKPKVLINQHAKALDNPDEIQQALADYHAFCGLVLDQTLRGILHGLGPEELRTFIQLPPSLEKSPWIYESYGLLEWYAPYIANYALGWWDGDASTLSQVTPTERASRLVPLMGGRDAVLTEALKAEKEGDLVWALEMLNYLWRDGGSEDEELRKLKARMMRSMGQATTSSIHRAFLVTQALANEGAITVPRVVAPQPEQVAADPNAFVSRHRVRIDPMKADSTDAFLRFEFPDQPPCGLRIRQGVATYLADAETADIKATATLKMSGEAWYKLYVNEAELGELTKSGDVKIEGNAAEAKTLLALFDRLGQEKNNILQPAASIHAP